MKTYIQKPITIRKPKALSSEAIDLTKWMWEDFLKKMVEFNEKFCIFSRETEPGVLVISAQKINLDEEDMCEFLYYFENMLYDEFKMLLVKKITIEFERICLDIEVIFFI
jgi:hypothetical protein